MGKCNFCFCSLDLPLNINLTYTCITFLWTLFFFFFFFFRMTKSTRRCVMAMCSTKRTRTRTRTRTMIFTQMQPNFFNSTSRERILSFPQLNQIVSKTCHQRSHCLHHQRLFQIQERRNTRARPKPRAKAKAKERSNARPLHHNILSVMSLPTTFLPDFVPMHMTVLPSLCSYHIHVMLIHNVLHFLNFG